MKEITTVGVDLAKSVFTVHGVDAMGRTVLRKTVRREQADGADRGIAAVCDWHGSLWWCARVGAEVSGARSPRRDHDGALCGPVSQELEERRQRRRGDLRSGGADPTCASCR